MLLAAHDDAPDNGRLFLLTLNQYETQWRKAFDTLGLNGMQLTPHTFRHGGASADHLANVRTKAEIQQRGRWRHEAI
eukprot:2406133-Heterocapsa_arctica.AAC.1